MPRPHRNAEPDTDEQPRRRHRPTTPQDQDQDTDTAEDSGPERSQRKGRGDAGPPPSSGGWGGREKVKQSAPSGGDYPDEFKVTEKDRVFMFLDDAPIANFLEHWVNEAPQGSKKSWVCGNNEFLGLERCPLCDVGHGTDKKSALKSKSTFNVVDLEVAGPLKVEMMTVGPMLGDMIEGRARSDRGPAINEVAWVVKRTQEGRKTSFRLDAIKLRDLEEDWGITPPSDEVLDELYDTQAFTEKDINWPSLEDLEEIADLIS